MKTLERTLVMLQTISARRLILWISINKVSGLPRTLKVANTIAVFQATCDKALSSS